MGSKREIKSTDAFLRDTQQAVSRYYENRATQEDIAQIEYAADWGAQHVSDRYPAQLGSYTFQRHCEGMEIVGEACNIVEDDRTE
ncbi:MAG TPA: hypothetical protein VHL10_00725 [Nitrososphaera sp.]|jgi:hypothetical protein|nr:hypothetical protein [Nitrososphaera sp.]